MVKVDPNIHYNENYFYEPGKPTKTYVDQFGITREYHGPAKDWHGFSIIAMWIKENFPEIKDIYDMGCGAGSFVARANSVGLSCFGCDISRYAIKNCVTGAGGKVRVANIVTDPVLNKKHDLVTALDLMEHIYEKDLQSALNFITEAIKPGGYFFACVATARHENEIWTHTSEVDEVPADKRWLAVSGHVNVKFSDYWLEKFIQLGFKPDYEKMYKFQIWRMLNNEMKNMDAWSLLNVFIGKK